MIGAGIAYIVNIVMSLYEMIFTRLIKNKYLLKLKRAVSMILAYLTFMLLISWLFSIVLPDLIASINSLLKIDTSGFSKFIKEVSDNKGCTRVSCLFWVFIRHYSNLVGLQ